MEIEFEWESLDENTRRAKVIGGWLVMRFMVAAESDYPKKVIIHFKESLVFIPDRNHVWEIKLN